MPRAPGCAMTVPTQPLLGQSMLNSAPLIRRPQANDSCSLATFATLRHASARTCGVDMCTDMCIDICMNMCVGMRKDMCIDMCIDMCMDMCTDMSIDMYIDMCRDMYIDMCRDVCMDMCRDMCLDVCTDMCIDMCIVHTCASTCEHVHIHVRYSLYLLPPDSVRRYGHACRYTL